MRDYSKVSGNFWTRGTGKNLRGDIETQLLALYLMTSPHATMIGVYYLPILYIQNDTHISNEGAMKGLQRLFEEGFCTYDEALEMVFVHEMATYQVGEELKPADNRVKDIQKQYDNLPESSIKSEFFDKYAQAFHLKGESKRASPSEAPSKPEAGTEAGAGIETGTEGMPGENAVPPPKRINGTSLPKDWVLPQKWGMWAMQERPEFTENDIRKEAEKFKDHWLANANRATSKKADWELTWRNWIRKADAPKGNAPSNNGLKNGAPWFMSAKAIEEKAIQHGIDFENTAFPFIRAKVYQLEGITEEMVRKAEVDFGGKAA